MLSQSKFRTVLSLGCIVLFCIFYWDIIILRRLYSPRHSSRVHADRDNKSYRWSWECVTDGQTEMCRRVIADSHSPSSMSLATCTMTCSPGRHLWPHPTGKVNIKNTSASIHPSHLKVDFAPVENVELSILLKKTTKLYQERISKLAEKPYAQRKHTMLIISIDITKSSKYYRYRVNIDESYKLLIIEKGSNIKANIKASTFLGAHHGLETLTQLIWWDDRDQGLRVLNSAVITDAPLFTYRGILLDTARNFIPVSSIMTTVEAMSMNKMNLFHWHLTDSKGFPYASETFPKFRKSGARLSKEIYSVDDIKQVVAFAEVRGVSVLLEVDAPAHTSQGWDWGEEEGMGNLTLCLNAQPFSEFCLEAPCGQLNPVNDNATLVLVEILKELNSITKSESLMHLGGDDVDFRCWESFGEVTDLEVYMNKGIMGVWEFFYHQLFDKLANNKILPENFVVWSNELLDESNVWKRVWKHSSPIIQSKSPSTSGELERLVKKNFRVIVSSSNAWHLGDPLAWLSVYHHRPWTELSATERKLVLGGEACAWTDHLDRYSLDPWLWPAAAAVAERLWADPAPGLAPIDRLAWFRERMVQVGVQCSPVGPKWCLQNPCQCL